MPSVLKQILSVLLFCCLTMPFLGTWLWMKGQIQSARQSALYEMEKGVPEEQIVLWKFSCEQAETILIWKHSREFQYQGEMYDIIRSEIQHDSVLYWCYHDHKETQMRRNLSSLWKSGINPHHQHSSQQKHITSFLTTLFCHNMGIAFHSLMHHRRALMLMTDEAYRDNPSRDIPSPPPRKV